MTSWKKIVLVCALFVCMGVLDIEGKHLKIFFGNESTVYMPVYNVKKMKLVLLYV